MPKERGPKRSQSLSVRMLARFGLPERWRPIMPIPLITDSPLYLRVLSQYNRRSKRGGSARGIPSLWDGAGPFREERCAAKARRRTSLWLRLPLAGAAAQNNASVVVAVTRMLDGSVLLFPSFGRNFLGKLLNRSTIQPSVEIESGY